MSPAYPETRRDGTVDVLHGREIADPYRWLEDPDSPETKAWVAEQNRLTRSVLDDLPARPWFQRTMEAVVRRPRAGTPERTSGRYLVSRNDGTLQQDQWFVADSLEELRDGGRLVIDPNTFSADGTASLAGYDVSRDGRLLAYRVSEGGSDWTTIRIRDLETGEDLDDVVTKVKFSRATWLPDHRSYLYLYFPVDGARGTEAGALPPCQLRLHRVGTPQDQDALLLEFPDRPRMGVSPTLSHDGRWVVADVHEGTSEKNRIWVYPVEDGPEGSTLGEPLKVVDEVRAAHRFVRTDDDVLYLLTMTDAPLGRVVRIDLADFARTGRATYVDVVPESGSALWHAAAAGEEILTVHLVDATPKVTRHALDGSPRGDVPVTGGGVVALHAEVGDDEVFLGLSSVTEPVVAHRLDLASGAVTTVDGLAPAGTVSWTSPAVVSSRRTATSPDGTAVPYFLIHRADLDPAEPRPTLLYGYGGFGIPILADYRPTFAGWLAAGGVLAIANLRGGSEYGDAWHDGGRLLNKQNVFDDFAAVGDHLVADGVTTHSQLALHGGSNGGLLVGATLLQRPDLAAAAMPSVGVLDMLRFHLFTIGGAWVADYGSPEDPEMFETLLAYSPLHRVRDGAAYPATLVLTGDHDDRVVPAHSFKFTAALQRAQAGEPPVLARIETSTGHGLGKPASVIAAECADLLAFAAEHTGLVPSDPAG